MATEDPVCRWCKRRPQLHVEVDGERIPTGRCSVCADAFAAGHARIVSEREGRERRAGEVVRREKDGMPAVLPRVERFRRDGAA